MTNEVPLEILLAGFNPEEHDLLLMDCYDECIIGVVERAGQSPIVCYDRDKVLQQHMDDGMDYEEALEFFEFNQLGAWVGDATPCFLTPNGLK